MFFFQYVHNEYTREMLCYFNVRSKADISQLNMIIWLTSNCNLSSLPFVCGIMAFCIIHFKACSPRTYFKMSHSDWMRASLTLSSTSLWWCVCQFESATDILQVHCFNFWRLGVFWSEQRDFVRSTFVSCILICIKRIHPLVIYCYKTTIFNYILELSGSTWFMRSNLDITLRLKNVHKRSVACYNFDKR